MTSYSSVSYVLIHPSHDRNATTVFVSSGAHIDNRRHGTLQFRVTEDSVMHGLAGYFEATLYKDVKLSIRPQTHSPGMFSWFPILFPIKVSFVGLAYSAGLLIY